MIYFFIFISFLIIQRVVELMIAKRNELNLINKGGKEYDVGGYKFIVLLHSFFKVSLISEFLLFNSNISALWFIILPIYILIQIFRYWIISSLGQYWNTKLIFLPQHKIIKRGPYKLFRHPNYLIVISEFIIIPLLFNCYLTLFIFSILNLYILNRRIKIENNLIDQFGVRDSF